MSPPLDVYYCEEYADFYDARSHKSMGLKFYRKWWQRRNEFVQAFPPGKRYERVADATLIRVAEVLEDLLRGC